MGQAARLRQSEREIAAQEAVPRAVSGAVLLQGYRLPWDDVVAKVVVSAEQTRAMEREAVKGARMAGVTWSTIAEHFGGSVSRTQLARRYPDL